MLNLNATHEPIIIQEGHSYVSLPFKCPCCELPLYVQADVAFFVYCPHGVCDAQVCNDGASGNTLLDAIHNLLINYKTSSQ